MKFKSDALNNLEKLTAVKEEEIIPIVARLAAIFDKPDSHELHQVFQSEHHGNFSIGTFIELFTAHPENFGVMDLPLSQEFIDYLTAFIELDNPLIQSMADERRDEPVFGVELLDESPLVLIDGHHRVLARWFDGFETVRIVVMPNILMHLIHRKNLEQKKDNK